MEKRFPAVGGTVTWQADAEGLRVVFRKHVWKVDWHEIKGQPGPLFYARRR